MLKRFTLRMLIATSALALFATGCSKSPASLTSPSADGLAPLVHAGSAGKAIPGSYIVVYKDGENDVDGITNELANRSGFMTRYRFRSALHGFAASNMSSAALRMLRNDPRVAYVEENQEFKASVVQTPATWGLDRIDQKTLGLTNSYT